MKFTIDQSRIFSHILDLLIRVSGSETQAKLPEKLGLVGTISQSDLSKAKGGHPFGDEKWEEIENKIDSFLKNLESKNEATEVIAQVRAMLVELKEKPRPSEFEIAQGDVPRDKDLRKALLALEFNRKVNDELWRHLDTDEIHVVTGNYAGFTEPLTMSLRTRVSEIDAAARGKNVRRISYLTPGEADFRKVIRWASAQTRPLMCLFPFYLTSYRRSAWGVVRYAGINSLGLVAPRGIIKGPVKHPQAERIIKPEQWHELLNQCAEINTQAGYATEEILCELTMRAKVANPKDKIELISAFNEKNRPLSFSNLHKALQRATQQGAVFAYDLADDRRVKKFLDEEKRVRGFETFKLQHDLNIPVGIGFSLPLFPWIKDHFRELQEAALAAIDGRMVNSFERIGIKVDKAPPKL